MHIKDGMRPEDVDKLDMSQFIEQARQILEANRLKYGNLRMEAEGEGGNQQPPGEGGEQPSAGDPSAPPAKPSEPAGTDKGFPANTPLAEMTVEQQAAYHKYHSRKWQQRAEAVSDYEQQKADAEKWRQFQEEQKTPAQKLIDEARADERAKVLAESTNKISEAMLRTTLQLRGKNAEQIDQILSTTNLEAFAADGDVDTDKVAAYADLIAGPVSDPKWPDMGQGTRGPVKMSGMNAGREMARNERNPQS